MTSTADARDLDPWGFGRCDGDDRAVDSWVEPLDEVVADEALPGLAGPPAVPATVAAAVPAAAAITLRLPFPANRLGILAFFGAVIVAQAFYIGLSLTAEASARPAAAAVAVVPPPTPSPSQLPAVAPPPTAPVPLNGTLRIDTSGAAASVRVDEEQVGPAPYARTDIPAGDHIVRVDFAGGGSIARQVTIAAGERLSLLFEAPARVAPTAGPISGWLRLEAPFDVQVFEGGHLVGSSASDRLMMSAATHRLELVNAALGYRALVTTTIGAGRTVVLPVDVPRVPVHLNAAPWAEVLVDGRVQGETPLANVLLPLGPHQIVFRHPDLGERVESVTVRATGANRVSADLRRP